MRFSNGNFCVFKNFLLKIPALTHSQNSVWGPFLAAALVVFTKEKRASHKSRRLCEDQGERLGVCGERQLAGSSLKEIQESPPTHELRLLYPLVSGLAMCDVPGTAGIWLPRQVGPLLTILVVFVEEPEIERASRLLKVTWGRSRA